MVMIDTSVWIDYFSGKDSSKTNQLNYLLKNELICIGDIILLEVLQGIRFDKEFERVSKLFQNLITFNVLNTEIAYKAAQNYRFLRAKGITIRKSVDCIIATYCIENDIILLHNDKDFIPFSDNFNLKVI